MRNRTGDAIPAILKEHDAAKAYFGAVNQVLERLDPREAEFKNTLAQVALTVDEIIERNRIVNWTNDTDVQNKIRNEIEDCLFDLKNASGIDLTFDDMDEIMEQCIEIAKYRRP